MLQAMDDTSEPSFSEQLGWRRTLETMPTLLENNFNSSQTTHDYENRSLLDKIKASEHSFVDTDNKSSSFQELAKRPNPSANLCDLFLLLKTGHLVNYLSGMKFFTNSEYTFTNNLNPFSMNLNDSNHCEIVTSSTPVPVLENSTSLCSSSGVSSGSRTSPESTDKRSSDPPPSQKDSAANIEDLSNDSASGFCNHFGSSMLETAQLFQAETILIGQKMLSLIKACHDQEEIFDGKLNTLLLNSTECGCQSIDIKHLKELIGSHFKALSEIQENHLHLIKAKLVEDTALAHIWLHITKSGKQWDLPVSSLLLRNFPQAISLLFDKWFEETNRILEDTKNTNKKLKKELQLVQHNTFAQHLSLSDDHQERICSLISDHDLQLKSALERAKNARQQSACLQLQLVHLQDEMSNKLKIYTEVINDLESQIQQLKENHAEETEDLKMKCRDLESKVKSYKKELLETSLDRDNLIVNYENENSVTSEYVNTLEEKLSKKSNEAILLERELKSTVLQNNLLKEKEMNSQRELETIYSEILALMNINTDTLEEGSLEIEMKSKDEKNVSEVSSNILAVIEKCKKLISQQDRKIREMLVSNEKLKLSEELKHQFQNEIKTLQREIRENQENIQELARDNKKLTGILTEYTELKSNTDYKWRSVGSKIKEVQSDSKPHNATYDYKLELDAVKTKKQLGTLQDYLKIILQERHNLYIDNRALKEKVDALNAEVREINIQKYFNKLQMHQWKERVLHLNNALNEAQGQLGCMSNQLNQQFRTVASLKYRFKL